MSLLQVDDLQLRQGDRYLIRGLNLYIEPGQCWVVLGRNGSGKTSLLRTLAGIQAEAGGAVRLGGTPLQQLPPRQRARRIGLVFQHSDPGFHSTTLEMALSGGYPHRGGWGWESAQEVSRARQALQSVGLEALAERPLESLSGGELRRAEIARLLVQRPAVAMLDEPLNHLDLAQQLVMLRLLRQRFTVQGHALLLVLHDLNLARRVASHLLLLHGDGRWQAGPVAQLGDAQTLGELLGYPLQELRTAHGPLLGIAFEATDPLEPRH